MSDNTLFQYCQKLVVISADKKSVLLAKRKNEDDYNGTFSFIGGKMETTDESILAGMKREKDEEIGQNAKLKVLPDKTFNVLFRKKDGNSMTVPHIPALFVSGDIKLSDEYSEYKWVPIGELKAFEPKIKNIPETTLWAVQELSGSGLSLVEI